jgi:hypothetical protein
MRKGIILAVLFSLFLAGTVQAEEIVINPFKELVAWTLENNIGMTFLYDLDEKDYSPGGKWGLITSEHQWLFAGLSGKVSLNNEPALHGFISFNLGKLLQEKIFKRELQYLDHLEVGYYSGYNWGYDDWRDGVMLNALKKEF